MYKPRPTITALKLSLLTLMMFAFGFLLVPIYDVICDVTGLNGKTSGERYRVTSTAVDQSRSVRVQLITMNNDNMSWEFKPMQQQLVVNPGQVMETQFYAKNPRQFSMIAQAVPSISPARAAAYFHKTECFCFNQQTLLAGQDIYMPLRFIVNQELPKDITTITLSYTLFDITNGFNGKQVAVVH
ncbi:cytochrome c oxidase assembly protein subunit 11 [Sinobacterium caligoides]|uniref:Cytochrome c oxidase assembly protein CtaG n=1 Tax=Sinobacterium caligoides TaxID=933926 RepID=A0A3N2DGU7_9GAMM|nr:cytochrome c oxidase assembly protein [Sinobacterium caligoides]ROR98979.1 cytochrome c oxidase assembly protein subunit 11 [Sinobacterium caligoides]